MNAAPAVLPIEYGVHDDLSTRWAPVGKRRHAGLLVAALLIVVAAAVGGTTLVIGKSSHTTKAASVAAATAPTPAATSAAPVASSNPAPSKPNPSAAAATDVSALLDASAQARSAVVTATGGLSNCTLDPSTAASNLAGVVALRRSLVARSESAPFAALPAGAKLKSLLTQAWAASLSADQSYLSWAQDEMSSGCDASSAGNNPNFAAAAASSAVATPLKAAFSILWNSAVAVPLHVSARTPTQI